jgi:hypothetical protein
MLAFLRRRLHMIRYYSASRPRTIWSRAADVVLIAGFVCALPAAWIADATVMRSEPLEALDGGLARSNDRLTARIVTEHQPALAPMEGERLLGAFTLMVWERRHGWPLTGTRRHEATLRLRIFTEPEPRENEPLDHDEAVQRAIAAALLSAGRSDVHAVWWAGRAPVSRHVGAWAANVGFWWIALAFAGWMMVGATAAGMLLRAHAIRARIDRRRMAGCCMSCGYNLTGLEFSERCPECGEVAA